MSRRGEAMKKVHELMSRDPVTIDPDASLRKAVERMAHDRIGFLPVLENGRVVGVLTDRDISLRSATAGWNLVTTTVRRAMSQVTVDVDEDRDALDALERMVTHRIHRLPVTSNDGRLVGIFSSADAAAAATDDPKVAELLVKIAADHKRRESASAFSDDYLGEYLGEYLG
jgi:CBS domain-containing protein